MHILTLKNYLKLLKDSKVEYDTALVFCRSESESEFGVRPLNPSQNSVHPSPKTKSDIGAPTTPPT